MNPFEIPSGWRFCPEDSELIKDYLYNKIMAQKLPFEGIIVEYDLYGKENPWEIWEHFSEHVVKTVHSEDLYVFTKVKRKNPQSRNAERKVGLGSWEGEAHAKNITVNVTNSNHKIVIGFMKSFRFEKSRTHQDGKWIMHEYSLHPSLFPSNYYYLQMKDYVLCRIRKNDRPVKLREKRKEPEKSQQKYYGEQRDNQRNKKTRLEPKEKIQKRICKEKKDNQRNPPAKIQTNMSMDDFCSWLDTNLTRAY
ncbi:hypothetical protein K1719_026190 [Acacia pycnantha]|nr:hypothetical protein K1719_026190 [Acacia pycnantha]